MVLYGQVIMSMRKSAEEGASQRTVRLESKAKETKDTIKEYEKTIKSLVDKLTEYQEASSEEELQKSKEDLETARS